MLYFSHGAASGLDVTMEGSDSLTQSDRQTVMGHYTCERNNFSLTCPMVTKLGILVQLLSNTTEGFEAVFTM